MELSELAVRRFGNCTVYQMSSRRCYRPSRAGNRGRICPPSLVPHVSASIGQVGGARGGTRSSGGCCSTVGIAPLCGCMNQGSLSEKRSLVLARRRGRLEVV